MSAYPALSKQLAEYLAGGASKLAMTAGDEAMADHNIKGKTVIIAGGAKNLGGLIARECCVLCHRGVPDE